MSRIITVGTKGKVVLKNLELLKQALMDCIQSQQGSWITEVRDYAGHPNKVETGIRTAAFERGIGFRRAGDHYEAIADFYGKNACGQALMNEIAKNYQKHANLSVLRELNYISTVVPQGNEIMVTARQY